MSSLSVCTRSTAMVRTLKANDRFRCRDCHRVFQLTYTYEARKPGIKELITEMAFNGAGVRDTARTLKIGINTVIRTLKNSRQSE
ncbi:Transposase [Shigella dysenteriae 1617]|uniref:Transposase n=1 Tax=Shigella dysenteriae 1617 TaxID=754093 RepID=A0A0A6ZWF7_SHIDY|nr:Transposase [Shigella dysenteriae 1617]